MGVRQEDRLAFVGLLSALIFVVGAPLVPFWGVWADKYTIFGLPFLATQMTRPLGRGRAVRAVPG